MLLEVDSYHSHGTPGLSEQTFRLYSLYLKARWIEGKGPRFRTIGKWCPYCGYHPNQRAEEYKEIARRMLRNAHNRNSKELESVAV